jgi:hypothetical protein
MVKMGQTIKNQFQEEYLAERLKNELTRFFLNIFKTKIIKKATYQN